MRRAVFVVNVCVVCCGLFDHCFVFVVLRCMSRVSCCLLGVVCWLLFYVCCALLDDRCLVVCCALFDGCCLLVVCCVLFC